jgi:hypothetical protein
LGGKFISKLATLLSFDFFLVNNTSKTLSVGNTGSATNGQVRITKIKVIYQAI